MNIAHIQEEDQKFLLRSIRFCMAIDPYTDLLGLNKTEVEFFKSEITALLYIGENYKSFSTSFIIHNIGSIRMGLTVLVEDCLRSVNYTKNIGKVLGIKEPVIISASTFEELDFYRSFQN